MTTWEYLVSSHETDLNALGQQGWELVAVLPTPQNGAPTLYFKRPAADFRQRVTAEQKQRYYASLGLRPQEMEGQ